MYTDKAVVALLELEETNPPNLFLLRWSTTSVSAFPLSFKLPFHYNCLCVCIHSVYFKKPQESGQITSALTLPASWRLNLLQPLANDDLVTGSDQEPRRNHRQGDGVSIYTFQVHLYSKMTQHIWTSRNYWHINEDQNIWV